MTDPHTIDRHIDTLAALNVVAAAVLIALSAWLVGGLHASVNRDERELRLHWAAMLGTAALVFVLMWIALQMRLRVGGAIQIGMAIALLPVIPIGSVWGGYALWVLARSASRERFAPHAAKSAGTRPYGRPIAFAIVVGVLTVAIVPAKARQMWLTAQVNEAARTAKAREDAIADQAGRLRAAGLIDGEGPSHRIRR